MATKEEMAARLNGRPYREEVTPGEALLAKSSGLVIVFGYSDDGVELRGAIDDELGAGSGSEILLTAAGLLKNACAEEDCPYFLQLKKLANRITCHWGKGEATWTYTVPFPHATFDVVEDGEVFCKGVVFSLADVPLPSSTQS